MLQIKTINLNDFGGGSFLSGLDLLNIFNWYEWVVIFLFMSIIFKYFEKYFLPDDKHEN